MERRSSLNEAVFTNLKPRRLFHVIAAYRYPKHFTVAKYFAASLWLVIFEDQTLARSGRLLGSKDVDRKYESFLYL